MSDASTQSAIQTFSLNPTCDSAGSFYDVMVRAVTKDEPFAYAKLNHGFWERLLRIRDLGVDLANLGPEVETEIDRNLGISGTCFAETGFLSSLLGELAHLPSPSDGFNFSAAIDAFPGSAEIEGTPVAGSFACSRLIQEFVDPDHLDHAAKQGLTGFELKAALIAGRLQEFTAALAARPFLLVASKDMAPLREMIDAKHMHHIPIAIRRARCRRTDTFQDVLTCLDANRDVRCVVLRCGGSLSTWLSARLFRERPDLCIFDWGNGLSIANPKVALRQNWCKVYAPSISTQMHTLKPGWFPPLTVRDPDLVAIATSRGVATPKPAEDSHAHSEIDLNRPISFVENKKPNLNRIRDVLHLSERENRYANGGPVSRLLEDVLATAVSLPEGRKIIATSSCTSALFAGAGLCALKSNAATLRWVTSAFTFFSSNIGPLSNGHVIDSGPEGQFDLDALKRLPRDSWDGVLFTNIFAQARNWSDVRDYCQAEGKHFLVDNAVGLQDRAEDAFQKGDIEALSLHQTKPWGTGEGGCLIVNACDEEVIRGLINFASTCGEGAISYAANAKISDLASAAILDRIERMTHWKMFYQMQARRILSVVRNYDIPLKPLESMQPINSPRAFVPLVCDAPVSQNMLKNDTVALRKYYAPLRPVSGEASSAQQFPMAQALFDRMVCVPCNPELRLVSNEQLASALLQVTGRAFHQ